MPANSRWDLIRVLKGYMSHSKRKSASATNCTATIRTFAEKEIKDQVGRELSVPLADHVACAQMMPYVKSLSFFPPFLFCLLTLDAEV